MKFFSWMAGVLSDPNDKQGSTQRLCLIYLLWVVGIVIIVVVAYRIYDKTIDIPTEVSSLIKFLVGLLVAGIGWAKGVAGVVSVKGACNEPPRNDGQGTTSGTES